MEDSLLTFVVEIDETQSALVVDSAQSDSAKAELYYGFEELVRTNNNIKDLVKVCKLLKIGIAWKYIGKPSGAVGSTVLKYDELPEVEK